MKQLVILGGGVRTARQMTLEALEHIKDSDVVVMWGAAEGANELLDLHAKSWVSANELYVDGALDQDNYARIERAIVDRFAVHEKISVMVQGHPRVGVTFVQNLKSTVAGRDIEVIVLPGVSSFDTMLNDVEQDPLEEGSCVVDANRLILYNYDMDRRLNYYIYHVCSIGNRFTDFTNPTSRNKSTFLRQKLLRHYGKEQEVRLVKSSISGSTQATLIRGTVGALDDLLGQVDFASSLFIPASLPTEAEVDKEFLECLTA